MNNDKIFQLHSAKAQYAKQWDDIFSFISEKQIKDDLIWQLLLYKILGRIHFYI